MIKDIMRLISLRETKAFITSEENKLTRPMEKDYGKIQSFYEIFCKYHDKTNSESKRMFLFCIQYLFSPSALAGAKMQKGLRVAISDAIGDSKTLISHNCENLLFMYKNYERFRVGVKAILMELGYNVNL